MPITTLVANTPALASDMNNNFTLCVLTDTVRTISVSHVYTASQTFSAGWSAADACTLAKSTNAVFTGLQIRNTSTGTGAYSRFNLLSDDGSTSGGLYFFGSNFTTVGVSIQHSVLLWGTGAGGVSISTNHASGAIRLYTGSEVLAVTVASTGAVTFAAGISGTTGMFSGAVTSSSLAVAAAGTVEFGGRSIATSPSDGVLRLSNNAANDFGRLQFGGTTSSFPALKRASATLEAVLADDSGYAAVAAASAVFDQAAGDGEIVTLRSSDVAHGMTSLTATSTYGLMQKATAASGGVLFWGLTEGDIAMHLRGTATAVDTTKSTSGVGSIIMVGSLKSTTTETDLSANANIVVIRNNGTTRFAFDVEGSGHADVEWTTF